MAIGSSLETICLLFGLGHESGIFEFKIFIPDAGDVLYLGDVRLERVLELIDDLLQKFLFGGTVDALGLVSGNESKDGLRQLRVVLVIVLYLGLMMLDGLGTQAGYGRSNDAPLS